MLHLLADMDAKLRTAVNDFDFNTYVRLLTDFANEDLSAFFFDIRKDCLYCDAPTDSKRMAYRTVLDILFHALVRYAAPVLVFTSEEVWQTRFPDADSVHFSDWPEVDAVWANMDLVGRWQWIRGQRQDVTLHIEPLRREKVIGSSLEAKIGLYLSEMSETMTQLSADQWEEIFISSEVYEIKTREQFEGLDFPRTGVKIEKTNHHKCGRCWRHLPEVADDGALCGRCEDVVGG
jgi:isoleucyl-tRNA synthetase